MLHFHDKVVVLGFHLDQISYGTLINGLCKVGETKAALRLLRRVDGKLVQPDVVMYNTIIIMVHYCEKLWTLIHLFFYSFILGDTLKDPNSYIG